MRHKLGARLTLFYCEYYQQFVFVSRVAVKYGSPVRKGRETGSNNPIKPRQGRKNFCRPWRGLIGGANSIPRSSRYGLPYFGPDGPLNIAAPNLCRTLILKRAINFSGKSQGLYCRGFTRCFCRVIGYGFSRSVMVPPYIVARFSGLINPWLQPLFMGRWNALKFGAKAPVLFDALLYYGWSRSLILQRELLTFQKK